jgi:hypothetical protein
MGLPSNFDRVRVISTFGMERMGALVEVYWTFDLVDAICARSFLDSRGFCSFLRNEHHITQSSAMLGLALGGYLILVIEDDAMEAKSLLKAAAANEHCLDDEFDESQISLW